MNSYKFNYVLEKFLPNDFPLDIVNLIGNFLCDCNKLKCDYCQEYMSCCYLKRCACCKKKSCGLNDCLNYPINYFLTYQGLHKVIKVCHKCPECKSLG